MAVELPINPDESLIFHDFFQADKYSNPFAFAASDKAIYISKEKHFAKESWYYERIPLRDVKQVFLRRERSHLLILLSVLLILAGSFFAYNMMSNALNEIPGTRVSGIPFGMIAAGLLIPFLARGRKVLVFDTIKGIFKWKPKFVVDKKSRDAVKDFQSEILSVCEKLKIKTENFKQ
jgi:hypothetical protein